MSMTQYIKEIQKQLILVYEFKENPNVTGVPMDVPDGIYPMVIEGKTDRVQIKNGRIYCCNWEKLKP